MTPRTKEGTIPLNLLHTPKETLIIQLWAGMISEREFIEQGTRLNMSLEELGLIVAEVRAEDGIGEGAE